MNPLSKEAREALASLDAREPTAADERRVRENLERTLGIVVPVATVTVVTTATTAAAASTGLASSSAATASTATLTSLGLGAKVVLFVAAVGVGSIAAMTVKSVVAPQSRAPAPVVQPVVTSKPAVAVVTRQVEAPPPAVAEPEPVVAEEPAAVVAVVNPPVPAEKRPTPRAPTVEVAKPVEDVINALPASVTTEGTADVVPVPKPAEPSTEAEFELSVEVNFPNCDVSTEMRSALAARRLLTDNHPEHALFLLGAYQKRCASGRWSDEAWRVRLASLCRLGRNKEAVSLLEWFTTEYPARRPAIESMLRGSCAPEVLDGPEKP